MHGLWFYFLDVFVKSYTFFTRLFKVPLTPLNIVSFLWRFTRTLIFSIIKIFIKSNAFIPLLRQIFFSPLCIICANGWQLFFIGCFESIIGLFKKGWSRFRLYHVINLRRGWTLDTLSKSFAEFYCSFGVFSKVVRCVVRPWDLFNWLLFSPWGFHGNVFLVFETEVTVRSLSVIFSSSRSDSRDILR